MLSQLLCRKVTSPVRFGEVLLKYRCHTSHYLDKLVVSLVGRPNTGKSTLFNRLTRSRQAIVSHVPGTTRDRREGMGQIAGMPIKVVDTGGLDDRGAVCESIKDQVEHAIKSSHVVLFLIDSITGVTATDQEFCRWIRKRVVTNKQQVVMIANKAEGAHLSPKVMDSVAEILRLGIII